MGRDGRMGNDEQWMRLALAAMWTVAAAARISSVQCKIIMARAERNQ